jgi:hypothetical protein
MNPQLHHVVADVTGATGLRISAQSLRANVIAQCWQGCATRAVTPASRRSRRPSPATTAPEPVCARANVALYDAYQERHRPATHGSKPSSSNSASIAAVRLARAVRTSGPLPGGAKGRPFVVREACRSPAHDEGAMSALRADQYARQLSGGGDDVTTTGSQPRSSTTDLPGHAVSQCRQRRRGARGCVRAATGEFRSTTVFRKNLPMVCPARFAGQIEMREVPDFAGAPGRIRTSGPQIRSLVLNQGVGRPAFATVEVQRAKFCREPTTG